MKTVLTAATLLTPRTKIDRPQVTIEDGVISSMESRGALEVPENARHLGFPGAMLVPSYFDIHTHGAMGHDVMEGTDEAFGAIAKFLALHGVGAYLPTTVTASLDNTLRALEAMARQIERAGNDPESSPGAKPLGIHLEGPFLSHSKRGIHPAELLRNPSIELLHRFWEASAGRIVLLTIAPELPQAAEFIHEATRLGIRTSLGHSDATTEQSRAGIAAGASSATHTFNAMRVIDRQDPGLLAVVLDEENLFAEIICDGVHVHPVLVRLFHRSKKLDRGILITDATAAAGMPDGTYMLGDLKVDVVDGKCSHNGALSGSSLSLDRGVRNFVEFTKAPYSTAVQYASSNPAALMNVSDVYGELAPGRPANITILSAQGEVLSTLLNGNVFNA